MMYAIYRGDEFLFVGTLDECAERFEVKHETIKFLTTPSYHKRINTRKDPDNCLLAIKFQEAS